MLGRIVPVPWKAEQRPAFLRKASTRLPRHCPFSPAPLPHASSLCPPQAPTRSSDWRVATSIAPSWWPASCLPTPSCWARWARWGCPRCRRVGHKRVVFVRGRGAAGGRAGRGHAARTALHAAGRQRQLRQPSRISAMHSRRMPHRALLHSLALLPIMCGRSEGAPTYWGVRWFESIHIDAQSCCRACRRLLACLLARLCMRTPTVPQSVGSSWSQGAAVPAAVWQHRAGWGSNRSKGATAEGRVLGECGSCCVAGAGERPARGPGISRELRRSPGPAAAPPFELPSADPRANPDSQRLRGAGRRVRRLLRGAGRRRCAHQPGALHGASPTAALLGGAVSMQAQLQPSAELLAPAARPPALPCPPSSPRQVVPYDDVPEGTYRWLCELPVAAISLDFLGVPGACGAADTCA